MTLWIILVALLVGWLIALRIENFSRIENFLGIVFLLFFTFIAGRLAIVAKRHKVDKQNHQRFLVDCGLGRLQYGIGMDLQQESAFQTTKRASFREVQSDVI